MIGFALSCIIFALGCMFVMARDGLSLKIDLNINLEGIRGTTGVFISDALLSSARESAHA